MTLWELKRDDEDLMVLVFGFFQFSFGLGQWTCIYVA